MSLLLGLPVWALALGAIILFAVAAFSIYRAFQKPGFVINFFIVVARKLFWALRPALLRMLEHSPETDEKTRRDTREGTQTEVGKGSHHGGENR